MLLLTSKHPQRGWQSRTCVLCAPRSGRRSLTATAAEGTRASASLYLPRRASFYNAWAGEVTPALAGASSMGGKTGENGAYEVAGSVAMHRVKTRCPSLLGRPPVPFLEIAPGVTWARWCPPVQKKTPAIRTESPARCHFPCVLQWLRNSLLSALNTLRRVILASRRLVCTEYRSVPIALAMAFGLRIGLLPLSRFHLSGSPDSV
jgi:hypothetical protein